MKFCLLVAYNNRFGFVPSGDTPKATDTVLTMEVAPTSPRRQQANGSPSTTTWATVVDNKDGRPINQLVNNDTSAQTSTDEPCSSPTSKDPVATKSNVSFEGLKNYMEKLKVRMTARSVFCVACCKQVYIRPGKNNWVPGYPPGDIRIRV